MKKFLYFSFLFLCVKFSIAQDSSRVLHFPEVSWTVEIPETYKILDAEENAAIHARGEKTMENSLDVEIDATALKTLFSATKGKNYFGATISPSHVASYKEWEEITQEVCDLTYFTMVDNLPMGEIDSVYSTIVIDGKTFHSFTMEVKLDPFTKMVMVLLSRLTNGYDFAISYVTVNDFTLQEIRAIINRSKFSSPKIVY